MRKIILYIMLFLMVGVSFVLGYSVKKCDCDVVDDNLTDEEKINMRYEELNAKLLEYLEDIYSKGDFVNNSGDSKVYEYNLNDISDMGYDISMFVNPVTNESCNKEDTSGKIIVFGTNEIAELDYTYSTRVSCVVNKSLKVGE